MRNTLCTAGGGSKILSDLVEATDFPSLTQGFLAELDDDAEVVKYVQDAEDPAAALSALVREWQDPARLAGFLDEEVQKALEMGIEDDDEDQLYDDDEKYDASNLAEDEELLAWCKEVLDEDDSFEFGEAPGVVDGEVVDEEGDMEAGDDEAARDWRRLRKLMDAEPGDGKDPNDLPPGQRHPWFESRSLAPHAELPSLAEAGPNPLEAVFGLSLDSPKPRGGKKRRTYYPGMNYAAKDLNPYGQEDEQVAFNLAYMRFQQVMRNRNRKDPFKQGKLKKPTMREVATLTRFVSERGKITPRRRTGLTAKSQRHVKQMIKRARTFGLLPYTSRLQRPSSD